jgi:hypothetical protein
MLASGERAKSLSEVCKLIFDARVKLQYRLSAGDISLSEYTRQKQGWIEREDAIIEIYVSLLKNLLRSSSQDTSSHSGQRLAAMAQPESTGSSNQEQLRSNTPVQYIFVPNPSLPVPTSSSGLSVPLVGLIVSAFGTFFTIFFSWRTDRRNEREGRLKVRQLEQQLSSRDSSC